jgi:hypothetical protein
MSITSYYHEDFTGYIGDPPNKKIHDFMIIEDKVHKIHNVVVHRFSMGDVEDPDLYAGQPIIEWQRSEKGAWVMEHAVESPIWHRMVDHASFGYSYVIRAKLKDIDYTFYQLKWS